ncbi:MAG: DNA repair protein RadC [Bacteroidota bacterium]
MSSYSSNHLPIHAWAEADRPREKLLLRGARHLSNAELLAILLQGGAAGQSAIDLARSILQQEEDSLSKLLHLPIQTLCEHRGIGPAKAAILHACGELSNRLQHSPTSDRPQIRQSQDAFQLLYPMLRDLPHEEFWILLLNRANRVMTSLCISSGGVSGTVVDAKVVFKKALLGKACSLILAHNHPSGNLQASAADRSLTKKLVAGAKQLDLSILDHLIIAGEGYLSFADEGWL